jgi:hypothetical protein
MAGEKFDPSFFGCGGGALVMVNARTWYGTLEPLPLNRVEFRNGEFHD